MTALEPVLARADQNLESSLDTMFALCRIKSISTDMAYKAECRAAAQWLVDYLGTLGFEASVRDTAGHPMVVGHHPAATDNAPHVLFYGHYDVQPVDPLNLWDFDPFEPAICEQDGKKVITGRGTSDDKGQLLTFVEACRAYKEVHGALPVRVTLLFEGEEESGSPSLKPFLEANAKELTADFALICDTNMWDEQTPAISAGLRGLVGEELTIKAADRDLHSGYFGGAAANPIHILTEILAGLHDETGRVTLEGFYEGVEETPSQIKASWETLGMTTEKFLGAIGLSIPSGEKGRSVMELTWARPTAEVNGIWGGYTGEGTKTVLPAKAFAKISMRLVPHQRPEKVYDQFEEYFKSLAPPSVKVEVTRMHGGTPGVTPTDTPEYRAAHLAMTKTFGKEPIPKREGGYIPIVALFKDVLGKDSILMGFGLNSDAIHSPNEHYGMFNFYKGIETIPYYYQHYVELKK
jgi:acetylornithine deacetylase/succinyl-diaminopimelate desuccinylase-like protein